MDQPTSPSGLSGEQAESKLSGIVAAAVTPVTQDFKVDVPRLVNYVKWLLSHGCDMVSLFGTTGEGPSFPADERLNAIRAVIAAGVSPHKIVPAVMTSSANEGRNLYRAMADMGCRGALVMPPFFYQSDDEGVFQFCAHVAKSDGAVASLPILLYHYPAMSNFGFSHALITRLYKHFGDRLAGIKDSSGNLDHTLSLIAAFPKLSVFTGTDLHLAQTTEAGGAGIIGGVPNVNAELLRARLNAEPIHFSALDTKIATLFAAVSRIGGPLPIKAIVGHLHGDSAWNICAPPLTGLVPADKARLVATFEAGGYPASV